MKVRGDVLYRVRGDVLEVSCRKRVRKGHTFVGLRIQDILFSVKKKVIILSCYLASVDLQLVSHGIIRLKSYIFVFQLS